MIPNLVNGSYTVDLPQSTMNLSSFHPFLMPVVGFLSPVIKLLSHPRIVDWVKIFLLGIVAETTRRVTMMLFRSIKYQLCIESKHLASDESYNWLLAYWLESDKWDKGGRSFFIEVTTASSGQKIYPWLRQKQKSSTPTDVLIDKYAAPQPYFLPQAGDSIWFWWRGSLVHMSRTKEDNSKVIRPRAQVTVLMITRNKSKLVEFLTETKRSYQEEDDGKLTIRAVDEAHKDGGWREVATKQRRPLSTVIVDAGIKELLLDTVSQFLLERDFYQSRGVPWRLGVLLHGVPGCGKTSLLTALASELKLDIYVFSLSTKGLTDAKLARCMTLIPAGSIVCMEDVDCASVDTSRDRKKKKGKLGRRSELPTEINGQEVDQDEDGDQGNSSSEVSLSGLLQAIDGIAGSEGRILFMTTNHPEALDPALVRPGRADLTIELHNLSQTQAQELFSTFYQIGGTHPARPGSRGGIANAEKPLTKEDVVSMAEEWAKHIPDREFSGAALQGMLMLHKYHPQDAVNNIETWISAQLAERAAKAAKEAAARGLPAETTIPTSGTATPQLLVNGGSTPPSSKVTVETVPEEKGPVAVEAVPDAVAEEGGMTVEVRL